MARRRYLSHSITIDIDPEDVLSQLDDDDVLEEVRARNLAVSGLDLDYARRAYDALINRRYSEAIALLDRALIPFPTENEVKGLMSLFDKPRGLSAAEDQKSEGVNS